MKEIQYHSRRQFLFQSGLSVAGIAVAGPGLFATCTSHSRGGSETEARLKISLAQWSLHRQLEEGTLDNLGFAAKAAGDFDIYAIEYVSRFFNGKAGDRSYLDKLNEIAAKYNVEQLLIMVDDEGDLGTSDTAARDQAVRNHHKWVEAAKYLGCHSIRVNAHGTGSREEVHAAIVDGLSKLCQFAQPAGINVIVENHGGYSSNGEWLTGVIRDVGMDNCGTLPDFGNFCVKRAAGNCIDEYDRYLGIKQMLPYAKAVSAKSHDFSDDGDETTIDYRRMLELIKQSDYSGYIGIEYEGDGLSEEEGVRATKALIERYI